MKKVLWGALALAVLGFVMTDLRAEKENKEPTIKDIMTKAHKGGDSLIEKLDKELKEDEPKWDDIKKQTKELVELGTALGKAKPPKGEQESWDKLTKIYLDKAKELNEDAKKEDKKAAAADRKTLTTYCGACHGAHKPKPKE